jgi:hypothetical protein
MKHCIEVRVKLFGEAYRRPEHNVASGCGRKEELFSVSLRILRAATLGVARAPLCAALTWRKHVGEIRCLSLPERQIART